MTDTRIEIGNDWLARRIELSGGLLRTHALLNSRSSQLYPVKPGPEFTLKLQHGDEQRELSADEMRCVSLDGGREEAVASFTGSLDGVELRVKVIYQAPPQENFMRKRVQVAPVPGGWVLTGITMENLALEGMEGITPLSRWPEQYPSGEDKVHTGLKRPDASNPGDRLAFGETSRSVIRPQGADEGLYFFTQSLLGSERWERAAGLQMGQREFCPLRDGFDSGWAVIGAWAGAPGIGFKRYTEHLEKHWCVVRGKSLPVSWSTWLVTMEGNKPLYGAYDRDLLLRYLDLMHEAGFYDLLHLDLGWEAGWPMQVDTQKFPNGMQEVSERARELGLDMTYWVNPFSSLYWKSEIEEQHPEWLVPGTTSGKCGATAICVLTDHFENVRKRFVELVTDLNARVIYWDGLDWNIPECSATGHCHSSQHELEVKAWKRLADLCENVHRARPDALFVVFSLPFDNHRLCVLDQEQVSDTYSFPTIESELVQRQQLYQMTFEHPNKAIWGSWYGINWHNAGEDNLTRPVEELIHAEMSMIANGIAQAGGGFDLAQAQPGFIEFLRKLFAFRKRFEDFFDTYQHVLGFPDGERVDGSGHIIDGKGFIVLVNPTHQAQIVRVPLEEPELELSPDAEHALSDWSSLDAPEPLGSFRPSDAPEIELGPLQVRYVGVNV